MENFMKKRYVWAKNSQAYHDRHYNQERCNVDDLKDASEGDSPPAGRRICIYCERQKAIEDVKEINP